MTTNLSLGIGIFAQIGVLIWSACINPSQSYTQLSLCVCACAKCTLNLCMVMYNYALSSWSTEQKLDFKNNSLLKNFCRIPPRNKNILPRTIFTQKYPMVNFSQTTVILIIYMLHGSFRAVHAACRTVLLNSNKEEHIHIFLSKLEKCSSKSSIRLFLVRLH